MQQPSIDQHYDLSIYQKHPIDIVFNIGILYLIVLSIIDTSGSNWTHRLLEEKVMAPCVEVSLDQGLEEEYQRQLHAVYNNGRAVRSRSATTGNDPDTNHHYFKQEKRTRKLNIFVSLLQSFL